MVKNCFTSQAPDARITNFKHYCLIIRSKKFSLEKFKDAPNSVCFYTGFENYDSLITVIKCLEPKASKMYFWQGTEKCKDGTLKYQNENVNKPGLKRKLSLLEFSIVLVRLKTWYVFIRFK